MVEREPCWLDEVGALVGWVVRAFRAARAMTLTPGCSTAYP